MTNKTAIIAEITPDPKKQRLLDSLEKPMGGVGRDLLQNVAKVSNAIDMTVENFRAAHGKQTNSLTAIRCLLPTTTPVKNPSDTPLIATGHHLGAALQKKTRAIFTSVDTLLTKPLPSTSKRHDNTPDLEQRGAVRSSSPSPSNR